LRAFYAFMWGYPGKKLLFMGQEFAQAREWSEERALDWHLLDREPHRGMQRLVRDLNRAYRSRPALHGRDCEPEGFSWLLADERDSSVFAWVRHCPGANPVAVVSNFTPVPREDYRVPLPEAGRWREILNTDARDYGGSGKGNAGAVEAAQHGQAVSARMLLPPLATVMLEFEP
jgi:1,4-alpha-glucan branching enzyme